jgi:hypothetical protein
VFDVVTLCNALVYVPADGQAQAIRRIAGYNQGLLAVTGGHKDTIARDLDSAGYEAVMDDFRAVHAGWTDRFRTRAPGVELPPNIFADPFMDPIDDRPGWRYRHGAIFRKRAVAAAA